MNILYVILAILGLGLLVFIHEMGHFLAARWVGMRVEVFSLGFGKPFMKWEKWGVQWQLCYILFGGYVKIAGMEREEGKDPYLVKDGYYSKSPWKRIFVIAAGPVINIVFAFLLFTAMWAGGGREQPFKMFTKIIGAIDPETELYEKGVRAGDEIQSLGGKKFEGFQDLLYSSVVKSSHVEISGEKIDYYSGQKVPFDYQVKTYPSRSMPGLNTIGVQEPASYLIYEPSKMLSDGPVNESTIKKGDRIIWADGELIFSTMGLTRVVNESAALLTVKRGDITFLAKVPRMQVADLRLQGSEKAELDDWHYAAGIREKINNLYFIPYVLSSNLVVEKPLSFINDEAEESTVREKRRTSHLDILLRKGDQIVAVDGLATQSGYDLIERLQTKHVQLIVKRAEQKKALSWKDEDRVFINSINWSDLSALVAAMPGGGMQKQGDLVLLKPVQPVPFSKLSLTQESRAQYAAELARQKKSIEKLKDPKKQEVALKYLSEQQNMLSLGVLLRDRMVNYNPSPFKLCVDLFAQTGRTLSALITGKLHPKWLSGPVGMVQMMQHGWSSGLNEALYWLGTISMALGIFNLLPLPVLDGGHIVFSLFEVVTRRRVNPKAIEKLIIPFVVLIIGLFIYITYNDLARLIQLFK